METKKGKTVFIEYSTANKGQHFMTVVQNLNHERIIIGRIYREYNSETKKYNYRATDFQGGQIFADYKDLYAIKNQFKEHGESLAMAVPIRINNARQLEKLISSVKADRNKELKNIREKKTGKEKTKEVSKTNPNQKEKEQDSKNTTKFKDAEQSKEEGNSKENEQTQETAESNPDNTIQEEPEDKSLEDYVAEGRYDEFVKLEEEAIAASAREFELDQIREQQDENREEEIELDM